MKRLFIYVSFLFLVFFSCTHRLSEKRKKALWAEIRGDNVDRIIEATLEIQEANDTSMFDAILYKADDPRITHNIFHKGKSVYQVKMLALKRMTGINPPNEITYIVDTAVIKFYIEKTKEYRHSVQ